MIICEVGLNHLGSERRAYDYIDCILNTNADAITFQVLQDSFYKQKKFNNYKLNQEFFINALKKTKNGNKMFGVAIDDEKQIITFEKYGVDFFKILSKDLNNYKLLDKLFESSDKPIYISTGMSNLREIEEMLSRYNSKIKRIILIQTQLSNKVEDINFNAIPFLKIKFNVKVAFGFHCSNHNALYMSLGYNPESIFFYIKINNDIKYPDDVHAIAIGDISETVDELLELRLAIGSGKKVKMENWT